MSKELAEGVPSVKETPDGPRSDGGIVPPGLSSRTPLLGQRNYLFLDEAQRSGQERTDSRPDYPPLSSEERRIADLFAAGLFLSKSSCQWALYNFSRGDKQAFRRILAILAGKQVKLESNAG